MVWRAGRRDAGRKLIEEAAAGAENLRTAEADGYRRLLLNLRQQVVDGGRWISLAAANFSAELFWLRSAAIQHAAAEHRDYQLLERDFAAVGGDPGAMAVTPANIAFYRERALGGFGLIIVEFTCVDPATGRPRPQ